MSQHFPLSELIATSTGLPNDPPVVARIWLDQLCAEILEPARALWGGYTVRVNSGFRSTEVNAAIHGNPNSQHLYGQAADVVPHGDAMAAFRALYEAHKAGRFPRLGQAIIYPSGFIHLSIDAKNPARGEFLRSEAAGGSGGPYHPWTP